VIIFQVGLLVLGLLAALHAPDRPNLVLLDDLDRGLHHGAQKELMSLLRGLLETNPDLQVIATTHSPYMLDCMGTNEVRMTLLRDDGATVCAALTRHPQFEKWKDEMAPGELWSLFGEKWLAESGGRSLPLLPSVDCWQGRSGDEKSEACSGGADGRQLGAPAEVLAGHPAAGACGQGTG
jgi:hypothetical protein